MPAAPPRQGAQSQREANEVRSSEDNAADNVHVSKYKDDGAGQKHEVREIVLGMQQTFRNPYRITGTHVGEDRRDRV